MRITKFKRSISREILVALRGKRRGLIIRVQSATGLIRRYPALRRSERRLLPPNRTIMTKVSPKSKRQKGRLAKLETHETA